MKNVDELLTETRAKILGIIPARGGSKGVPRKNIRVVAGRPLIAYAIEAAKGSRRLSRFVVSTDDGEIACVARQCGAEVVLRPPELAADDTPMVPVVQHALQVLGAAGEAYDYVVLLQPTAPLRTARHVDEALDLLIKTGADSVISVTAVPTHYSPHWQFVVDRGLLRRYTGEPLRAIVKRRQDLPKTYTRNGAIYACKTALPLRGGDLYGERCVPYEMSPRDSVNIDSEDDLRLAEQLLLEERQTDR